MLTDFMVNKWDITEVNEMMVVSKYVTKAWEWCFNGKECGKNKDIDVHSLFHKGVTQCLAFVSNIASNILTGYATNKLLLSKYLDVTGILIYVFFIIEAFDGKHISVAFQFTIYALFVEGNVNKKWYQKSIRILFVWFHALQLLFIGAVK